MDYYSAKKRNKLIHTTRMNLRSITSCEGQTLAWCIIPFIGNSGAGSTDLE